MSISKVKHSYVLALFVLLLGLDVCQAENCKKYRAKTDGIPVYATASSTAARRKSLKAGQEVCYIGELNGFAIVDLRGAEDVQRAIRKDEVGYVRLFDLWEPVQESESKDSKKQVQEFFDFWRRGGIPDDPFAPFRSLWGGTGPEPKCEAGKICEKVNKKLESSED